MPLAAFQEAGRFLAAAGLVRGSSGNLSVWNGNDILITRSGSSLAELSAGDIVTTGIDSNYPGTVQPSSEIEVHRNIYRRTTWRAVAHAHPPWAITLSFLDEPLPEGIATVGKGADIQPGAFGEEIASALKRNRLVMVRAHGVFAVSDSLISACHLIRDFEKCCREAAAILGLSLRTVSE